MTQSYDNLKAAGRKYDHNGVIQQLVLEASNCVVDGHGVTSSRRCSSTPVASYTCNTIYRTSERRNSLICCHGLMAEYSD